MSGFLQIIKRQSRMHTVINSTRNQGNGGLGGAAAVLRCYNS